MEPLVSICIPTCNRETLVQCAIASAQAQTYPNIEIIIADNCSTDNTEQVVRAIAQKDPRIRYIRNETNVGPTRNWQVAVNAAKGEYCKILYSDDEISHDFVSSCISQFETENDVAFVFTDAIMGSSFERGILSPGYCHQQETSTSKDYIFNFLLWRTNIVSPSCALFRTADIVSKIVTENPFFMTDKYAQNGAGPDALIFLFAASSHEKIKYIRKPLTLFRTSKDSISTIAAQKEESQTRLLNCYAKARYHFLRMIAGDNEVIWYLRFLSTLTGACRRAASRKIITEDLALKTGFKLTFFDFAIGCVLRQYRDHLLRPMIQRIIDESRPYALRIAL